MLLTLLVGLLAPASAADVIVFGDSWAAGSPTALQQALRGQGFNDVFVDARGVGGTTAAYWATEEPDALHEAVSANPDARWVWLSITGNDVFHHYANGNGAMSAADNEAHLRMMFDGLFAVHPDIKVVLFGYDFVNFEQSVDCILTAFQIFGTDVTTRKVNEIFLAEVGAVQARVAADYPQVTYIPDVWGTLQAAAGVPNAPDVNLPSPKRYYADCIHPTAEGYRKIHDVLVAAYWGDPSSAAWVDDPPQDDAPDTADTGAEPPDTGPPEPAAPDDAPPDDPIAADGACACATPLAPSPWILLVGLAGLVRRRQLPSR